MELKKLCKLVVGFGLIAPLLFGCDNFDPDEPNSSTPPFNFSLSRQVTITGVTMGKKGTDADAYYPLEDVTVYAFVAGLKVSDTSDEDGGWALKNIPLRPSLDEDDPAGLPNIIIFVEKAGYEYDGQAAAGIQNWYTVNLDAHQDEQRLNFHVHLEPFELNQLELKVTSSLLKPHDEGDINDYWLGAGTYGDSVAERDEVFMRSSEATITLTFNMAVDTTYATNFIEFYEPDGSPVSFTGSWDTTATIYTITPSGMSADNDDTTQYRLSIARPVRAFNTDATGTRYELEGVHFQFDYLKATRNTLLTAQAPSLYPQGEDFTAYTFDRSATAIAKSRLVAGTNVTDVVVLEDDFCLRFTLSAAAASHKIYWRNLKDNTAGLWTDVTASFNGAGTFNELGDGTAYDCVDVDDNDIFGADDILSAGEQVQFVVVAVDYDGNEASINSVASPLTIQDNWAPYIASTANPAYNITAVTGQRDEFWDNTPTGLLTFTFSEVMDTALAASAPVLASLSGKITSLSGSGTFNSTTEYKSVLSFTLDVPSTTLSAAADAGGTRLRVASVDTFNVGDAILIHDANVSLFETATITDINSYTNELIIGGTITNSYAASSTVELEEGLGGTGLTHFVSTLASASHKSDSSVTVQSGDGSRFYVGQQVKLYYNDEEGITDTGGGPYTIASISSDTLTFTAQLGVTVLSGSYVVDKDVTAAEPVPRPATALTLADDILFDGTTAATTLTINNFSSGPDTQADVILVADSSNIHQGDMILVAASSESDATGVIANLNDSAIDFGAAHNFLPGDIVEIVGANINNQVSTAVSAGATNILLTTGAAVVTGEVLTLTDDEWKTELTVAAADGATAVTVADDSGLAAGQSITIDSGVEPGETFTIASVPGANVVNLGSAITRDTGFGIGATVTRSLVTEAVTTTGDSVAPHTTIPNSSAANNYSTEAFLTLGRPTQTFTVDTTGGTTITLNAGIGATVAYPVGTEVNLVSFDELREVNSVDGDLITLSSNLNYSHRSGAAVTKQAQAKVKVGAGEIDNVVVGDTVVCDSLADVGGVEDHADRFSGTVAALDTAAATFVLTSSKTGLVLNDGVAACTHMGDSVSVSGALDNNGVSIRNTWGFRVDLNGGAVGTPK